MSFITLATHKFPNTLKRISAQDTSADPGGWTAENPLWGHCAVVALLAQDVFGGELVRASLKEYPEYVHLKSHFWNRLPNGEEVDFTSEQYFDMPFRDLEGEVRSRESVLESPDTQRRYALLTERYESRMNIKKP